MREFTPQELSSFKGRDGNPTYIAFEGKVYDVSGSSLWIEGIHMNGHYAGADLSGEMNSAPHGVEVLERFPQIGTVKI